VTDRYRELEARSPQLLDLYLAISHALQGFPSIEIDRIDWTAGGRASEGGARAAQPNGAVPTDVRDAATVYGRLPVEMLNDQRAILNTINGFATALGSGEKTRVKVMRMPFDIASEKSLRGAAEDPATAEPPKFVVRVSRSR
jgi:hypothetical protein